MIIIALGGCYASGQTLNDPVYLNVRYLPKSQFKEGAGLVTEYLRTLHVVVAPALSHRMYKNFFAHLKVGYTPVRGYQFLNDNFQAIQPTGNNLRATAFVRMGISYCLEQ